jgi:hypothetical protein
LRNGIKDGLHHGGHVSRSSGITARAAGDLLAVENVRRLPGGSKEYGNLSEIHFSGFNCNFICFPCRFFG